MPNVLEKGFSFNDNSVYTYGGNKTFVGVSSIPNARRCEYGIGSASCSFSDDNSLYIYESEDTELPFLMNYTTDRDQVESTVYLNGASFSHGNKIYVPIYPGDALKYVTPVLEGSGSTAGQYYVYTPTINGVEWIDNITIPLDNLTIIGATSILDRPDSSDYEISVTFSDPIVKISSDVSAFSLWSSLTSGDHYFTIKAKADGYSDSDASAVVVVNKSVSLISFTIAGTTYEAEEGMTWSEWISSSYNTTDWEWDGTQNINIGASSSRGIFLNGNAVQGLTVIVAGGAYTLKDPGPL